MTPEQFQELKRAYKQGCKELNAIQMTDKMSFNAVQVLQMEFLKKNPKCVRCGNTANLTYDHIIPVSILSDFNIDGKREYWEENGDSMCRACNKMKADHLDLSNPKTKELLKQLIETGSLIA